jgi:hypothetical protein
VITGKISLLTTSVKHYKNKIIFVFSNTQFSDDEEVATFFPIHKRLKKSRVGRKRHQQLRDVDTFSIQEMTIIESESDGNDGDKSSDEDDCDSQLNLELPQRSNETLLDKFRQMFCCSRASHNIF